MQSKLNHSYIERILYSKQFRSLQDKTQLFYPSQKHRVRTRLTHTIEVRTVAHKIACLLNEKIAQYNADPNQGKILPVDTELVDAIALAHDIGHTPFGHIGERTIDAVVSGKDNLGGLLHPSGTTAMRFKHNTNAMRILVELGVKDWRIIEGALSHTRICYKNDNTEYPRDPYQPFANYEYRKLTKFILSLNGLDYRQADKPNPPSLTLEGQIIAMADEIAQRVADIGDAMVQTRYLDYIEKMLDYYLDGKICPEALKADPFSRIEWVIFTAMAGNVVQETFKNLQNQTPVIHKFDGLFHPVYTEKVVAFSAQEKITSNGERIKSMKAINDDLDDFVRAYSAQSEEVRESDSRSKYIIRQLFKAYINDVTLLPDAFLEDHLLRIRESGEFHTVCESMQEIFSHSPKSADAKNNADAFDRIKRKDLRVSSDILKGKEFGKRLLHMDTVVRYFAALKANNVKETDRKVETDLLFDKFLLDVGFYIASLTNTEAFDAYNRIYGHTT